jgi:hypothetical protein
MLLAKHITIGPLVPEDFGSIFCWANDAAAAGSTLRTGQLT